MATTASAVVPDLTKVIFNPSKSVTFVPVAKKQMVNVEVTNNSPSDVAVKFKNTGPTIYKTVPPQAKIGIGEKKVFQCIFKGQPKEKCKTNDRFTVVFIAASKNVVIEKAWKNAHKTATLKHKIAILFQGVNDQRENEAQQATNNDEDEDKDRQGQMRSKSKAEAAKQKKATVVMFMRKEGESMSDEDDEDGQGTAPAGEPPADDMMTTRPAGNFGGQVTSNETAGTGNPNTCSRGAPPTIQQPSMSSAVALLGQDVDFTCIVNDLGSHMVAFVKADSPPRLLSFDEKVFRRRDKYELKPRIGDLHNEWVLTIKNVQESDRGNYSCQINTEPIILSTGELDVKVPPIVSRSTPAAVEVREGNNVSLTCKADGNPTPTVIWRRQDRQIIRYNGATGFGASVFHGPVLHLTKVSRKHMSEYVCVASNGIPPDESWTVKLLVTFPPLVQAQSETVQASVGSMARMVCTTEAWPRPEMGWEKDGEPIYESNNVAMTHTVSGQYHSVHILEIRNVQSSHFGVYRCVAKNDNGIHHSQVTLNQISHNHFTHSNLIPEGSGMPHGYSEDDEEDEEDDDNIEEDEDDDSREEDGPSSPPELEFYSQSRRHESRNAPPTTHSELRAIQVDSSSLPSLLVSIILFVVFYGF